MKYRLYKVGYDDLSLSKSEPANSHVSDRVEQFCNSVVRLYMQKQKSLPGIKSLGNEIRYDPEIRKILSNSAHKHALFKLTENRRSFLNVFFEVLNESLDYESLNFIVFGEGFGAWSNIVDSTHINIEQIQSILSMLNNCVSFKNVKTPIYFYEIYGFDGYTFIQNSPFVKLEATSYST